MEEARRPLDLRQDLLRGAPLSAGLGSRGPPQPHRPPGPGHDPHLPVQGHNPFKDPPRRAGPRTVTRCCRRRGAAHPCGGRAWLRADDQILCASARLFPQQNPSLPRNRIPPPGASRRGQQPSQKTLPGDNHDRGVSFGDDVTEPTEGREKSSNRDSNCSLHVARELHDPSGHDGIGRGPSQTRDFDGSSSTLCPSRTRVQDEIPMEFKILSSEILYEDTSHLPPPVWCRSGAVARYRVARMRSRVS